MPADAPDAYSSLSDFESFSGLFTVRVRIKDYDQLRLRPHPIEFHMYYDV